MPPRTKPKPAPISSSQDVAPAALSSRGETGRTLKVEYVPIGSVRPNQYNPNRQTPQDFLLLLKSIDEEGFNVPIIVHRETREIIDGEHRWRGLTVLAHLKATGAWQKGRAPHDTIQEVRDRVPELVKDGCASLVIPVVLVSLTAEQMRVATLRRNRTRGYEDQGLLSSVFRELKELGALDFASEALCIDQHEIDALLSDASSLLGGGELGEAWEPTRQPPDAEREHDKLQQPPPDEDGGSSGTDDRRESVGLVMMLRYSDAEAEEMRTALGTSAPDTWAAKVLDWKRRAGA